MSVMKVFSLCMVCAGLFGCATSHSPQVYRRSQAARAQAVEYGTVEFVQPVRVEGTRSPVGAVAGGVAGGVIGHQVGSGSGKDWATGIGAVAGAVGGAMAEEKLTAYDGLEITVRLDAGGSVAVVQSADVQFRVGDRVRVLHNPDGTSRVVR